MQAAEIHPHGRAKFYQYYAANAMAADDLATQGARALAAMVVVKFSQNIQGSAPDGSQEFLPFNTGWLLFWRVGTKETYLHCDQTGINPLPAGLFMNINIYLHFTR